MPLAELAAFPPCVIVLQSLNRCILTSAIAQLQALLAVMPKDEEAVAPPVPPPAVSPPLWSSYWIPFPRVQSLVFPFLANLRLLDILILRNVKKIVLDALVN